MRLQRYLGVRVDPSNPNWHGWYLAGRHLVSPAGVKVTAEILEHLVAMHQVRLHFERVGLQAQAAAARSRGAKRRQQLVTIVVVDLATWREERGLGAA